MGYELPVIGDCFLDISQNAIIRDSMYQTPRYHFRFGPQLMPMVKYLTIACGITYLMQKMGSGQEMVLIFGLVPQWVLSKLFIWQLATYLFLHGGFWHLVINMFVLWMFGSELERYWGKRKFLQFFITTGVGAGILSVIFDPFSQTPTIGASGAIYGILTAYGMMFPERLVYVYFLFPVKVKYLVGFLGVMAFYSSLNSTGSGISHVAHLGGMIVAFFYLKGWLSLSGMRQAYYRWSLNRMRKNPEVQDKEIQSKEERRRQDDFWIN